MPCRYVVSHFGWTICVTPLYLIQKVPVAKQERLPTNSHRFDWTLRELVLRIRGFIWL